MTEVFGTETDEEGAEEGDEDMKDTDKEDKASTKKARRGVSKDTKEKNEVSGEQTASTGGETIGDHSAAEIIQSVHGMSVDCYAFVSIISVRGARYCAEAFAGDDKDVLSADFANGI